MRGIVKQHWRAAFRGIATLLLVVGLFFGYWWFYKLAPWGRTLSPEWRLSHSEQEYWRDVEKGIHRGMWSHDDGFAVGRYGDKSWAEWIMAHVKAGEDMGCYGRLSHSATSMCYITNQDVGEDAGVWLDWWAKNKSKSQIQWIADGFRQRGLETDTPPSFDQVPALLELLGKSDANQSVGVPEHWKYNAFRCLRDSGFDPVEYAISNRPVSEDVKRGLLEYAQLQRLWPAASDIGILATGESDDEDKHDAIPEMLTPRFQFVAYSLVFLPLILGTALLAWSFSKGTGDARLTAGASSK